MAEGSKKWFLWCNKFNHKTFENTSLCTDKGRETKSKSNYLYIMEHKQHFECINERQWPLISTEICYIAQNVFLTWIQMNLHTDFWSPAELTHSKMAVCKNVSHEKYDWVGIRYGFLHMPVDHRIFKTLFYHFSSNAKPWIFVAPCDLQQFVWKNTPNYLLFWGFWKYALNV